MNPIKKLINAIKTELACRNCINNKPFSKYCKVDTCRGWFLDPPDEDYTKDKNYIEIDKIFYRSWKVLRNNHCDFIPTNSKKGMCEK